MHRHVRQTFPDPLRTVQAGKVGTGIEGMGGSVWQSRTKLVLKLMQPYFELDRQYPHGASPYHKQLLGITAVFSENWR